MNINIQTRNNFKAGFTAQNSNFRYVDNAKIILPQGNQNNLLLNTLNEVPFNNLGDGATGAAKPVRPRKPILPTLQGGGAAEAQEPYIVTTKPVTPIVVQANRTFLA